MAHIFPTFPNSGDHNWAAQMNASLQAMVDKENALDDQVGTLINGIDGGNASSLFTGTVNLDGGGAAG